MEEDTFLKDLVEEMSLEQRIQGILYNGIIDWEVSRGKNPDIDKFFAWTEKVSKRVIEEIDKG